MLGFQTSFILLYLYKIKLGQFIVLYTLNAKWILTV